VKVALVTTAVGDESAPSRVARALAARGHRVDTVVIRRSDELELGRTLTRLRALRPDVTLSFGVVPAGWTAGFADVFLDIPAVLWLDERDAYFEGPRAARRTVFAMRQARRNLAPSAGHRAQLLARIARRDVLRSERLAQRIDLLPRGVDLPGAPAPSGGTELLVPGPLREGDGIGVLIDAVAALPPSARPTVWLAGDGPGRGFHVRKARECGVELGILGAVGRAELAQLLGRARAVVAPATRAGGACEDYAMAMAHGVPAIATALPGMDELVGDGGRLVPPGDAAALAAAIVHFGDDGTRAAAAGRAREISRARSWDTVAARLEAVLLEVAPRARRIWMVSPNPTSRGGVAAVARQIATSPLTRKYRISMLPTYAPGSMLGRLYRGAVGIIQVGTVILLKKPDLVHVKVASGGSFARKIVVGAICRLQGVPVLVHVHGGGFDSFLRRAPGFVRGLAHWWFDGTSQVLTLSDRWAAKLKPMFPNARIDVLPNPIEVARYEDLAQDRFARPLDAAPPPAPVALFLGDLLERKGAHALVRAWPEVVRRFPDARLVLCGTGDSAGLRALATSLDVADRVELPGWVDLAEKRRRLAAATAFVLPSHIEGVPISLLEAMASGLPSVVTPVGGILDAVSDEAEALVVPVGDDPALACAILRLFESPALARRLGEAARARVDEFDVGAFSLQLDRIYRRILGDEPPPSAQAEARAAGAEVA
jgi:glycosyltransferase involved in cell wall biosynthesis